MDDLQNIGLFLIAGLTLNLTPGVDMLYIIDRSLAKGKLNGIAAALGIAAGSLVHLVFAVVGFTSVFASSPTAMLLLKSTGALYLIWLGAALWRSNSIREQLQTTANPSDESRGLAADFVKGVAVNVLNPKIALFFIAFLPQFIASDAQSPATALIILGVTFNLTGTTWNVIVAVSAAWFRTRLKDESRLLVLFPRFAGALIVVIGVQLMPIHALIDKL